MDQGGTGGQCPMLDSLRRITQELNNTINLDEGLTLVVRGVKEHLATDTCSVYALDAAASRFVLMATDGLDPRAVGAIRIGQGAGMLGLVVERKRPISLTNAQQHARFRHFPEFGDLAYHAFLGVPIIQYREVLGVLVVRQLNDRAFAGEDEAFLMAIAAELAGLIRATRTDATLVPGRAGQQTIRVLRGVKGAPGIAIGLAVMPSQSAEIDSVPDRSVEDVEAEERAFERAVAAVREELRASGERMAAKMPSAAHAIFGVYAALLDDGQMFADTLERIRAGSWAPGALRRTIAEHTRVFEDAEDSYLRVRGEDIRGLGRRVLLQLQSGKVEPKEYPERCVLVGEEISVARIADVPIGRLAGIVCTHGSPFSHAAILARTLSIPAVMGVGSIPLDQLEGRRLLVDGDRGRVFIEPSPSVVDEFDRLMSREKDLAEELKALRDLPAETPDGVRVSLQVNAGLLSDLAPAHDSGAEGIGLYRTEFTFMVRDSFPSEQDQYQVYREVLGSFAPKPVTMRTLDVGGDKNLPYFPVSEANAFLGWRGIRLTLDNPGICLTQLRAMLRANAGNGNLQLLLPMISSPREVDEFRILLGRAHGELLEAGHATSIPKVGVMIEVPSVIYLMDALAKRVDYFSIGTNDLTQYLLAVDRSNSRVARHFDSLHPAVIRAIDHAVRQARVARKPISVCGEMAGDPASAVLLMGIGIDMLSMASSSIPRVKLALRTFSRQRARELLMETIEAEDPAQVHRILNAAFEQAGLGGAAQRAAFENLA
jgi:phosphotransferase system enzyme I (PtsP)